MIYNIETLKQVKDLLELKPESERSEEFTHYLNELEQEIQDTIYTNQDLPF